MGTKIAVHLRIITLLVLVTVGTQEQEINNSGLRTSELAKQKTSPTHNVDIQISRSVFVPSFGPPVPPSDYLHFNSFDPSLVTDYQYMHSHGFPYAGTYSYNKYTTPFVPSPPDYFLNSLQQLPVPQPRHSYAEGYLHQYQPQHRSEVIPSKPHVFQNVVNYGSISIHHGDHHEPHSNGKSSAVHPQHLNHQAYSLPFPQVYSHPLQHYSSFQALPPFSGLSPEQRQEPEDSSNKEPSEKPTLEDVKKRNS